MLDRVVWIHLEKRLDRKLHMERQLASSRALLSCAEVTCHLATPPHRLLVPYSFNDHAGHYSCRRAHLDVLERAYVDGVETLLVLEDDIVLEPTFDEALPELLTELPRAWWACYLGGTHREPAHPWGRSRTKILKFATRTHAMLLSRGGMKACYDSALQQPTRAIDQAYANLQREVFARGDRLFFAADPWLVHTRPDYSDNNQVWDPGTKHWDEQADATASATPTGDPRVPVEPA